MNNSIQSTDSSSSGCRVLCWNVLAQSYAFSHETTATALAWPERGQKVLSRIKEQAADLIALQEVDHWKDLYRDGLRQMGYEFVFLQRNGAVETSADATPDEAKEDGSHASVLPGSSLDWQSRSSSKRSKTDGIVIGWRRERFELADEHSIHTVDYDDLAFADSELGKIAASSTTVTSSSSTCGTPAKPPFSSSSTQQSHEVKFLRHNVGTFVFLKVKGDNSSTTTNTPPRTILFANTHLYWNPLHEDVKLKQLQYLLERIHGECRRRIGVDDTVEYITSELKQAKLNDSSSSSSTATPSTPTLPPIPSSIASFPFILAGDFNSSPMSKLYQFLTKGVYERRMDVEEVTVNTSAAIVPAVASSSADIAAASLPYVQQSSAPITRTPRFICDSDLSKVAKWLRSIGVDCAHYNDKEKKASGGATGFFKRALSEKRIIITRSMRLIERRGCPPWFLLRNENLESAFAALILHFGLQFEEDLFYSRCIFCNSGFDEYPAAYFLGGTDEATGITYEPHPPFHDIPRGFINMGYKDEQGTVLTFTRCRNEALPWSPCGKLFWWGARSGAAVETFAARIDAALNQQHHEAEGIVNSDAESKTPTSTSQQPTEEKDQHHPERIVSPERQAQLRLASAIVAREVDRADHRQVQPIPLQSVYYLLNGREPDFTNLTSTFHDTLDYIFFHPGVRVTSASPSSPFSALAVRPVTDSSHLDLVSLERNSCGAKPSINPKKKRKPNATGEDGSSSSSEEEVESSHIVPLSLVLPNDLWPSDHLLLQATFQLPK